MPAFHGLVQCITIGAIDKRAAAVKHRQGRDFFCFLLWPEQHPQRCLDQFGHGASLAGRFTLELRHDRVINVKGSLYMEFHISYMAVCQARLRRGPEGSRVQGVE
jgi:hypothetical protein